MIEVAIHRDAVRLDVIGKLRRFGHVVKRDCTRHAVGVEADLGNIPEIKAIPGVVDATDGDEMVEGFQTHTVAKPFRVGEEGNRWFQMQALGLFPEKIGWGLNFADSVYERLDAGVDGAGVVVGVPDNLIDISGGHHSEFDGRLIASLYDGYPGDATDNHGNWVAQIAAGATYGVAPGAQIAHARGLNEDNQGSTSILINAADAIGARHDSQPEQHLCNCSWGGSSPSYDAMVLDLMDSGCPVICAVGNSGLDLATTTIKPAESPYSLSVGGHDPNRRQDHRSNYGEEVDIYAGYGPHLVVNEDGSYQQAYGTSFAAPIVMGVGALLLEGREKMTTLAESVNFRSELLAVSRRDCRNRYWTDDTSLRRIHYPGLGTVFSLSRSA